MLPLPGGPTAALAWPGANNSAAAASDDSNRPPRRHVTALSAIAAPSPGGSSSGSLECDSGLQSATNVSCRRIGGNGGYAYSGEYGYICGGCLPNATPTPVSLKAQAARRLSGPIFSYSGRPK